MLRGKGEKKKKEMIEKYRKSFEKQGKGESEGESGRNGGRERIVEEKTGRLWDY